MTQTQSPPQAADLARRVAAVASEFAAPAADGVDREARFPDETISALRSSRMLSALVPRELGGEGASLSEVGAATAALARGCASSAMVFAMHNLQVAMLARHCTSEHLRAYLCELVSEQHLLASATTEIGTGGDTRSSVCAVTTAGGRYSLEKQAPVISYGEHADAILTTARRTADSPPSDQVLVLCRRSDLRLVPLSGWDTLGLRGTCSSGFTISASGDVADVVATPFGDIAAQTMLPVSHILWSFVWLGIASEALDRARRCVQAEAKKKPGVTPPAALRLAEVRASYDRLAALVHGAARSFDEIAEDRDALSTVGFTIAMNSLKVTASTLVTDIVHGALGVCGIAGYRLDSPYSMGRLLRDAVGASLMVSNDRILANNAQLLLMDRGIR
jgi:acyl-CoA dehydrogenase